MIIYKNDCLSVEVVTRTKRYLQLYIANLVKAVKKNGIEVSVGGIIELIQDCYSIIADWLIHSIDWFIRFFMWLINKLIDSSFILLLLWFRPQNLMPHQRSWACFLLEGCQTTGKFSQVQSACCRKKVISNPNNIHSSIHNSIHNILFLSIIHITVHRYIHSYISVLHVVSLLYIYKNIQVIECTCFSRRWFWCRLSFSKDAKNRIESHQE